MDWALSIQKNPCQHDNGINPTIDFLVSFSITFNETPGLKSTVKLRLMVEDCILKIPKII